MARLVCPVCATVLVDGEDPVPGTCPGCDSRYTGDGDSAPEAVTAALAAWDLEDLDADALTHALFSLPPGSGPEQKAAVISDEREGFYRWWVFAPKGDAARQIFEGLIAA